MILDPDSPEYFAALGDLGLEILMEPEFHEFTIVVDNGVNHGGGVEFTIHDPRAIRINSSHEVGLYRNESEEYPSYGFHRGEMKGIRMDIAAKRESNDWYTSRPGSLPPNFHVI